MASNNYSIPAILRSALLTGDTLYKLSTAGWGRLAVGATDAIMSVTSGLPAWKTLATLISNVFGNGSNGQVFTTNGAGAFSWQTTAYGMSVLIDARSGSADFTLSPSFAWKIAIAAGTYGSIITVGFYDRTNVGCIATDATGTNATHSTTYQLTNRPIHDESWTPSVPSGNQYKLTHTNGATTWETAVVLIG